MKSEIKIPQLIGIFILGAIAWFIQPEAIAINQWHTLVIFLFTIVAIVMNVMPIGAIGLVSIAVFALVNATGAATGKASIMAALSGLDSFLIWLIVVAFFIAKGFIKTGFGRRVALVMIKYLGKRTLGLVYGLSIADLILAPGTPSNTARCGGVIYPIANSLAQSFDSLPNDSSRKKIGTYLITSIGNINDITAAMFVTAYAANPLVMKLASDAGVKLDWGSWFLAALAPALVSLIVVPLVIYVLMKPGITKTPEAREFADKELAKMGKMSRNEWIMVGTFIGLLALWITGKYIGVHSTTAALVGLSVLLITGVLTWDDVKGEKAAWDTLIWFAALLMMAGYLKTLGFTQWLGDSIGAELTFMQSYGWIVILIVLNAIYTYLHYFFASGTAQVAALYAVFLGVGVKLGVPAAPLALLLGFSSSLYCSLTQYAHARGPILFGSGYIKTPEWWTVGFVVNLVNQAIFIAVGLVWWKMLGWY